MIPHVGFSRSGHFLIKCGLWEVYFQASGMETIKVVPEMSLSFATIYLSCWINTLSLWPVISSNQDTSSKWLHSSCRNRAYMLVLYCGSDSVFVHVLRSVYSAAMQSLPSGNKNKVANKKSHPQLLKIIRNQLMAVRWSNPFWKEHHYRAGRSENDRWLQAGWCDQRVNTNLPLFISSWSRS